MNKLKKFLILLTIIIIILSFIIYILIVKQEENQNNKDENFINYGGDISPTQYDNGFEDVMDSTIFLTIDNIIKKYEKICRHNIEIDYSKIYVGEDEYLTEVKTENQRKEAIYDLLDKDYIARNSIDINNISKYMFNIDSNTILVPKRAIYKYGSNINTYIYEIYFIRGNSVENKAFILRLNNKNSTFSIEFINEKFDDIINLNVKINDNTIQNTGYNSFSINNVKTEEMVKAYMDNYKELVLADSSIIYNNYLSNDYKEKRYGTLDGFESYVNENREEIKKCQLTKYSTELTDDGKTQYICIDQFGNYYIFNEKSTMQYTVKFDNYTILTDKFKTAYKESKDEKKVQMNVDRIIQMINRQDYKTLYDCVSQGFKNNYFDNKWKFEDYIKNLFFKYNKFEFNNVEKKGSNLYICNFSVLDITEENSDKKNIILIMKLNDDYNFEIAFNM